MHSFQCPHCGGVFQIGPELARQAVVCPHCHGTVFVPELPPTSVSSPAPPPVINAPALGESLPSPASGAGRALGVGPALGAGLPTPPNVAWSETGHSAVGPTPPTTLSTEPSVAEPPLVAPTNATPGSIPTGSDQATVPVPSKTVESKPAVLSQFVIPTLDGGQAVIHDLGKIAVSGSKRRQLRELTSEQKSTHRWIKNLVIAGVCGALLTFLMWWLLK